MIDKARCCCFLGHRKIKETAELEKSLFIIIENLIINKGVTTFYFGSKSDFNDFCHRIVTKLKEIYTHIQRIYVRAEFPYPDNSFLNYLLERYGDTYFPEKMIEAGKASYVERNFEMINNIKYCIIYYDENYVPLKRKNCGMYITDYKSKSGTNIAFNYAVKKCVVINVFEQQFLKE